MKFYSSRFSLLLVFVLFAFGAVIAQPATLSYDLATMQVGEPFELDVIYGNEDFPVTNLVEVQFVFEYEGFDLEAFSDYLTADEDSWFGWEGLGQSFVQIDPVNRTIHLHFWREDLSPVSGHGEMYGGKKGGKGRPTSNIVEIWPFKTDPKVKLVSQQVIRANFPVASIAVLQNALEVRLEENTHLLAGEVYGLDGRKIAEFNQPGVVQLPGFSGLAIVRIQTDRGLLTRKTLLP